MLAGATDAPISPITVACFDAIKATTPATTTTRRTPRGRSTPTGDGFVLGEGAAVLVLEECRARPPARRAHLREIAGYASRSNALPHDRAAARRPGDGRGDPDALDAGAGSTRPPSTTSTRTARAPGRTTGTRRPRSSAASASTRTEVPVSSIKSMVGHSLGAIGSIEIAACALAIEHGVVPPTANLHAPGPGVRPGLRADDRAGAPVDVVLSVGSGFGGFQSAMVLRRLAGRVTSDVTARAVVTGIGVVAPTRHRRGRALVARRSAGDAAAIGADHAVRPGRLPDPVRRGGARLRPPTRRRARRLVPQTDRWTHLGFAATAAGAGRRRAARPGAPDRTAGAVTGQLVRGQRVRPAGDASGCGAGRAGRSARTSRSPGSTPRHRADLHPPRVQGPVRGAGRRAGRRAGRLGARRRARAPGHAGA